MQFILLRSDPVLTSQCRTWIHKKTMELFGRRHCYLACQDAWSLLDQDSFLLRQAKVLFPELRWLLIAGSPCQDLTYAGYLNDLLGLRGKRSMLSSL